MMMMQTLSALKIRNTNCYGNISKVLNLSIYIFHDVNFVKLFSYLFILTQQVFNKGANCIRCMATIDVRCNYHDSNQLLFSQINHQ